MDPDTVLHVLVPSAPGAWISLVPIKNHILLPPNVLLILHSVLIVIMVSLSFFFFRNKERVSGGAVPGFSR